MLLEYEWFFSLTHRNSHLPAYSALFPSVEPHPCQLPYDTTDLFTPCHNLISETGPSCDESLRKVMASKEELAELHKLSSDYAPNDKVSPPPCPSKST